MTHFADVDVVLSTYNGIRYLPQQLDSLMAQSLRPAHVFIRDDGSTDGTQSLLRAYTKDRPEISLTFGDNVGASRSFLRLLQSTTETCQFVAFCDQDDVWAHDKLEAAVTRLGEEDDTQPLLYCGRVEFVDADLRHRGFSPPRRTVALANALVENVAFGCTTVMNRAARSLFVEHEVEQVIVHDWWCALVVASLGRVVVDDVPHIRYRQHNSNAIGGSASRVGQLGRNGARLWREGRFGYVDQACQLLNYYRERMCPDDVALVERFVKSMVSTRGRVSYALHKDIYRRSWYEDLMLRALIVTGRL